MESFLKVFTGLFFVFNPLAMVPLFLAVLAPFSHERQKKIIIRELIIAFITIVIFIFFGGPFLTMIGIPQWAVSIGGGVLLFLISISMIFSKEESMEVKTSIRREPLIVPLAIPGLAGPASMAASMVFAEKFGDFLTLGAFTLVWIVSLVIIYYASYLRKALGTSGLLVVEKLGGILICFIGSTMLVTGVFEAIKTCGPGTCVQ